MKLALPAEPVVYYECSYGKFRLTYHIPLEQLQRLVAENDIPPKVLDDYPDGVDVSCTEADFAELQTQYGFRPPVSPEIVRRAFFALLSSTRDWQNFLGSGLLSARDIEGFSEKTEALLRQKQLLEEIPPLPEHATRQQRKEIKDRRARQEAMIYGFLEQAPLEEVDPGRTLKHQKFSPIKMQEGENPAEFFSRLLTARGKGRND